MESRLGESVQAAVDRLLFGHQRLGPFDDVTHAVDETLLLRRQDELVVHLQDTEDKEKGDYFIVISTIPQFLLELSSSSLCSFT